MEQVPVDLGRGVGSHDVHRLVAEHGADAVILLGPDMVMAWASPSCADVMGWDPESLIGRTSAEFFHPDDLPIRERTLEQLRTHGRADGRGRFRQPDGTFRWMSARLRALPDDQGFVLSVRAIEAEVEALAQAEAALAELQASQDHLRATVDSMLDPHLVFEVVRDDHGVVVDLVYRDANASACAYLKIAHVDLIGASMVENFGDRSNGGNQTVAWCLDAVASGEPVILDGVQMVSAVDGEECWFDIRAVPIDSDKVTFTWRDVTARHRENASLRTWESRFRLAAEHATHAVVVADDGRVAWVSPALTESLGWPRDEWIGRPLTDLVDAADADAVRRALVDARRGGEPVRAVAELRRQDGGSALHRLDARAIDDDASGARVVLCIATPLDDDAVWMHELTEAARRYLLIADNMTEVVVVCRHDSVTWASPSLTRVLGWPPDAWTGQSLAAFVHPDDVDRLVECWRDAGDGRAETTTLRLRDETGAHQRMDVDLRPQSDWQTAGRMVMVIRPARAAATKPVPSAVGPTTETIAALVICRIDDFGGISSTLGASAADDTSATVRRLLQAQLGQADLLDSGDPGDFIIVLADAESLAGVEALCERIVAAATGVMTTADGVAQISMSVGFTRMTGQDTLANACVRAATGLLEAVADGGGRAVER